LEPNNAILVHRQKSESIFRCLFRAKIRLQCITLIPRLHDQANINQSSSKHRANVKQTSNMHEAQPTQSKRQANVEQTSSKHRAIKTLVVHMYSEYICFMVADVCLMSAWSCKRGINERYAAVAIATAAAAACVVKLQLYVRALLWTLIAGLVGFDNVSTTLQKRWFLVFVAQLPLNSSG